jgi:hypothetical protein
LQNLTQHSLTRFSEPTGWGAGVSDYEGAQCVAEGGWGNEDDGEGEGEYYDECDDSDNHDDDDDEGDDEDDDEDDDGRKRHRAFVMRCLSSHFFGSKEQILPRLA